MISFLIYFFKSLLFKRIQGRTLAIVCNEITNVGSFIRNEAKKEIHPRMIRAVRNRVPILQSTVLTMAIPPLSLPVTLRL